MAVAAHPSASDDLHTATLALLATSDATSLWQALLGQAIRLVNGHGGSFWAADDEVLNRTMVGGTDQLARESPRLAGDDRLRVHGDATSSRALSAELRVEGRGLVGVVRVCRDREEGEFDAATRDAFEALTAVAAAIAGKLALQEAANARSRDFALVAEMSREVTATLDLDRVLRAVVNLAARALTFDRGALALYEDGECDIRAVSGAESVDANDSRLKDLAARAAWAAGRGEGLYVSDREDPGSDAERIFLQFFGGDLKGDEMRSGLYAPLRDEEGIVGILVLESTHAEFATDHQREVIAILANQATVAIRNARLYSQVPLVDVLGALGDRRRAWRAVPLRRKRMVGAAVVAAVGALTLLRWPLRVDAVTPVLRPADLAVVRSAVDGQVEQVLVREGETVAQGAPLLRLRSIERQMLRDASAADMAAAEREAALAASRGDPAAERLARLRLESARQERTVADAELRASVLRAPVAGVVLTQRPEQFAGATVSAGAALLVIGRTDSLDVEFDVSQLEVARVTPGQRVRVRVDALPQRTFEGRVSVVAPISNAAPDALVWSAMELPSGSERLTTEGAHFPVRARIPNPGGVLRPGMTPYVRVLTESASLAERLLRRPVRAIRLMVWRMSA